MDTPLTASALTAGSLLSKNVFRIPPYQREYSWLEDDVEEFWLDLRRALDDDKYFLGLVILTEEDGRKQVVDGQQRLLTLTILASILYQEALGHRRSALADRIQADFLSQIDYDTDQKQPRIELSDPDDDRTLRAIISGNVGNNFGKRESEGISANLLNSYKLLRSKMKEDLGVDPFKRLGLWTNFITNNLYFALFVHPDSASAYRVFEVINTRGKELTTADLLKNYVLQQTPRQQRESLYRKWRDISNNFKGSESGSFVQYIRHVVTVEAGYILPKDLFDFIAQSRTKDDRPAPSAAQLVELIDERLAIYLQMIDPTAEGPASPGATKVFRAMKDLGVISVRPLLMAIADAPRSIEGMEQVLRLVVRRIVTGNLGTGNVERRLSEAARIIQIERSWESALDELSDLNPEPEEFCEKIRKRPLNKTVLEFLRKSAIEGSITPASNDFLHYIRPSNADEWGGFDEHELYSLRGTIGNTVLSSVDRRPAGSNTWEGVRENIISQAPSEELKRDLMALRSWEARDVEKFGILVAKKAKHVWY